MYQGHQNHRYPQPVTAAPAAVTATAPPAAAQSSSTASIVALVVGGACFVGVCYVLFMIAYRISRLLDAAEYSWIPRMQAQMDDIVAVLKRVETKQPPAGGHATNAPPARELNDDPRRAS